MDFDLVQVEDEWSEAYHEILDVLYPGTTPGLDYSSLEPGDLVDEHPPTYLKHYLDGERQEELIEEVLDRYRIPEDLSFEGKKSVMLSADLSTSPNNVDSVRTKYGLPLVKPLLEDDQQVKQQPHR